MHPYSVVAEFFYSVSRFCHVDTLAGQLWCQSAEHSITKGTMGSNMRLRSMADLNCSLSLAAVKRSSKR